MKIIAFSKDRAAQLDLLIRSLQTNWPLFNLEDLQIIYTYSNADFAAGYKKLQDSFLDKTPLIACCDWYDQKDFHSDLLLHTIFGDGRHLGFLTDDCLFYRYCEIPPSYIETLLDDQENLCFSFRLGAENNRIQNYVTGELHHLIKYGPKSYIDGYQLIKYRWGLYPINSNPGYIGSIDGCIYYRQYVISTLGNTNLSCPRAIEENLANKQDHRSNMKITKPFMIVPRYSNVVCLAINNVQTTPVECGFQYNYEPKWLNDKYLAGQIIDLNRTIENLGEVRGCHTECKLEFCNE